MKQALVVAILLAVGLSGCGAGPDATAALDASPAPTATVHPEPTLAPTAPPYPYPMRLEEVGFMGGWAIALAISDDRAFVRVNPQHFIVADISDPQNPQQMGRAVRVPSGIETINATGSYLLIGDGEHHLLIYEISKIGGASLVAHVDVGNVAKQVIISGDYAYVAAGWAGVKVVDLHNPAQPSIASTIQTNGDALSVAVSGNLLLVGTWVISPETYNTTYPSLTHLIVLDITDPANPRALSSLKMPEGIYADMVVAGNDLVTFNTSRYSVDLSDPIAPKLAINRDLPGSTTAVGSYLFEFNIYHQESPTYTQPLYVYERLNGSEFKQATAALTPLPDGEIVVSKPLVARGSYVYMADYDALRIYDITQDPRIEDTKDPSIGIRYWWPEVGSLSIDVGILSYGGPPEICVIDDTLYTPRRSWSLSQPDNPVRVDPIPELSPFCGVSPVKNGFIYLNYLNESMTFVNTSNPQYPIREDFFLTSEHGIIGEVQGDRLYFMTSYKWWESEPVPSTLHIFDISNSYRPALLGSYPDLPPNHEYDDLTVVGKYAFRRPDQNRAGTVVLDISDPANIIEIKNPSAALLKFQQAAVTDDTAFVGYLDKIEIYALDSLDTPIATLAFSTVQPSSPGNEDYVSVRVVDSRLYVTGWVGEGTWRLIVVDISDLAHPYILAQSDDDLYLPDGVFEDYLYFNGGSNGLSIYKLVPK